MADDASLASGSATCDSDAQNVESMLERENQGDHNYTELNNGLNDLSIGEETTQTVFSQAELDARVAAAVQKALNENFSKLLGQFAMGQMTTPSTSGSNNGRSKVPNFSFPTYEKEDKLSGAKNFNAWRQRFELDLKTNRLLSYIQHELGDEDVTHEEKLQLDAAALQHLRATTSHEIANSLLRFKSAFQSFKHLEIYYGGKKLQELIRLELRARRLHFAENFRPVKFITEFEAIIDEFNQIGTTFDDETLVAKFLAAIDERHLAGHPHAIFYNTMLALPAEQRTFEYVKQSFLNMDTRPSSHKNANSENRNHGSTSNKRAANDNYRHNSAKRSKQNETTEHKTLPVAELLKKSRVHLSELYNNQQRERFKTMSQEEKRKNQCATCNTYFHRAENCMFKTPFCYNCFRFGHSRQNCKRGNEMNTIKQSINACIMTDNVKNAINENDLSKSNIIDAKTMHPMTIENLFQNVIIFIVDSGATHHAVSNESVLFEFRRYDKPIEVRLVVENAPVIATSTGCGTILVLLTFGKSKHVLKIINVQLVKNLTENVLSVRKFNAQFRTTFTLNANNGSICYRETRQKLAMIRVNQDLYRLSMGVCKPENEFSGEIPHITTDDHNIVAIDSRINIKKNVTINVLKKMDEHSRKINRNKLRKNRKTLTTEKINLLKSEGDMLHARFAHISPKYLSKLRTAATGLSEFIFDKTSEKCVICTQAKMTRKSFTETRENARYPCEIIHSDLVTFSPPGYRTGERYLLTVVDNYTRYLQVFPIKMKSEVATYLEKAIINLKTMFNPQHSFRFLQTDNGTEFINTEVETILKKFDMQWRRSEPYEHQHNGLIERVNRTIEEKIRALLFHSGFQSSFWNVAASCAAYIYNRTPHAALDYITPYEKVFSKPPDVTNIRIFGSQTAVHDPLIPKGNKTQARAKTHYLVGFTPTGYLTFDPKTKKIHACCSVKINEDIQYKHDHPNIYKDDLKIQHTENITDSATATSNDSTIKSSDTSEKSENEISINTEKNAGDCPSQNDNTKTDPDLDYELVETEIEEEIELDWDTSPTSISLKTFALPSIYAPEFKLDSDILSLTNVPITYKEAISGPDRLKWIPAIKKELECMNKHKVWTVVPREKEMSIVPVKWIFTIKKDNTYKARLVAVGCRDTEKYTSAEKATPTPSSDTVRWLIAHVSYSKTKLVQLDITTAFLHAKIDRLKHISIPPGVSENNKTHVCKLNQALYGLTTSPRCWYQTFDAKLQTYGFERNIREPCLYLKKNKSLNSSIIALVYVDDVLLTSDDENLISETIAQISNDFEVKNLGFPSKFLGIDISIDEHKNISMSQEKFLQKVLKEFKMDESHPVRNPMLRDNDYTKLKKNQTEFPYKNVLGNLMWLAINTRPDIAFSVNFLARFQANPTEEHWIMLKRIMRYLNGTRNTGLIFDQKSANILDTYVDSSFMDDPKTKRSTSGYVIRYYGNVIAWKSRLQTSMSRSTTHAEYLAICDASTNIMFIANLINETLDMPEIYPIPLYEDNSACITVCEKTTQRTKLNYLDKPYLLVRELFEQKKLKPIKIASKEQIADLFTKPLTGEQFINLSKKIVSQITNKQAEQEQTGGK